MKKFNTLSSIIEQISGHDAVGTIRNLCQVVLDGGYCDGLTCVNCPFNSVRNMEDTAQEMEQAANT